MDAMTIQSLARLVGLLVEAGVDISEILDEAEQQGEISTDTWAAIRGRIDEADDAWESY